MRTSHIMLLVALLLPLFIVVSAGSLGFYPSPYEPDSPDFAVAHESTNAFEEAVEVAEVDTDEAIHVDSLSPSARRIFKEAEDQPSETKRGTFGWQSVDAKVCQDAMIVCDEFESPPQLPSHGTVTTEDITYTAVERNGELYLVETKHYTEAHLGNMLDSFITLFTLVLFAGLLALVVYKYRADPTTGVLGVTTFGVIIGLWPYFLLGTGLDSYWWLILPLTWIGILVLLRQIQLLFRYAAGDV